MMFRAFLDLLFPPLCHACKSFVANAGELFICADCLGRISFLESPLCTTCGAPFATESGIDHLCGACLVHRPLHLCRSATILSGPVQDLIHRFKYGYKVHLSQPLGMLTVHALAAFHKQAGADLVIPVPLHRKRLRQRGFNQSQLIGAVLAKQWQLPLEIGNLQRIRWTEPQITLDASERVTNVAGAFAVKDGKRLAGKKVLLVDDVLTTGSTMRACVEPLVEAGVAAVFAVTVARGGRQ
jgi:ComF family protein